MLESYKNFYILDLSSEDERSWRSHLLQISSKHPERSILAVFSEPSQLDFICQNLEDHKIDLVSNNNDFDAHKQLIDEYLEKSQVREPKTKKSKSRDGQPYELLQSILLAIHKSRSINEIEARLNEVINSAMNTQWVRVFFQAHSAAQEQIESSKEFSLHKIPLNTRNEVGGQVFFAKAKGESFARDEKSFLKQVAEAVGLSIERLEKLHQAENLKQQWEGTFDSISEPLCLTDTEFNIIKCNRSFAQAAGNEFDKLIGKNCFKVLKASEPLKSEGGPKGNFRIQRKQDEETLTYEVTCQSVSDPQAEKQVHLVMLKDITEVLRLERRVMDSAKMAELGTIGSSIAHELNNPLGGMLNFIQLLRMDLKEGDPLSEDIAEMEAGARRCKDIVENLLGFSRQHDMHDLGQTDLRQVVQQSIQISEIQTRSLNINIETHWKDHEFLVTGNTNLLAQALKNILQNSIDAIQSKTKKDPRYQGRIEVSIQKLVEKIELTIKDNGCGIAQENLDKVLNPLFTTKPSGSNSGLGLTVAYAILKEHGGVVEISSQPNIGTTAKISF